MDYKNCEQGIKYPPIAGNAVLFYSLRPNGELEEHSMHGGCPVLEGEKWGANLWLWSKSFIGRHDDFNRRLEFAHEELWQLRTDPFLSTTRYPFGQASGSEGDVDGGDFLYCPTSGAALAVEGALVPGGKTPRVGSRCTGAVAGQDAAPSEEGLGPVSVTVVNDRKTPTDITWAGSAMTLHAGQATVVEAGSIEDELSVVVSAPVKGKKKGRRPRPLRFLPSQGSQQTVLLSSIVGKGGSRAMQSAPNRPRKKEL